MTNARPPKVILDTDIGVDADDLGALAMLHHFVDRGEAELAAVITWTTHRYTAPAVDAVNRYYGHPDIPIGMRKAPIGSDSWTYCRTLAEAFPSELTHDDVPEATALYRKILAESEDRSLTIVTVGPLKNIERLLKSGPDEHSSLPGKELIRRKVKEFSIMGGQIPSGDWEWNFHGNEPEVAPYVLENLPVPLVISPYELGVQIRSGEVFNELDPGHPLYMAFLDFSRNAGWINKDFKGKILPNATFDQTSALYAVRGGEGEFWDKIVGGYMKANTNNNGGSQWVEGNPTNHSYLRLRMDPAEAAKRFDAFMLGRF